MGVLSGPTRVQYQLHTVQSINLICSVGLLGDKLPDKPTYILGKLLIGILCYSHCDIGNIDRCHSLSNLGF
jgi:hypothetical protein